MEGDDRIGARGAVVHRDDDGTVAHVGRHGLAGLRADDHLDAEPSSGVDEVGSPVGRGGQQEENSWHGPIMT